MTAYIEPDLFFARVEPGQRFRFRMKRGTWTDIHEGHIMTCTGPATRDDDAEDGLHVPFTYPDGETGAFWRSACDNQLFEILPEGSP